jgi:hypothetical protein
MRATAFKHGWAAANESDPPGTSTPAWPGQRRRGSKQVAAYGALALSSRWAAGHSRRAARCAGASPLALTGGGSADVCCRWRRARAVEPHPPRQCEPGERSPVRAARRAGTFRNGGTGAGCTRPRPRRRPPLPRAASAAAVVTSGSPRGVPGGASEPRPASAAREGSGRGGGCPRSSSVGRWPTMAVPTHPNALSRGLSMRGCIRTGLTAGLLAVAVVARARARRHRSAAQSPRYPYGSAADRLRQVRG